MKKIFFLLLFFFSSASFADTYPALTHYSNPYISGYSNTFAEVCSAMLTWDQGHAPSYSIPIVMSTVNQTSIYCSDNDKNGITYNYKNAQPSLYCSLSAGGTLSGTSCINAPACVLPQVRNTVTAICQTPPLCSVGTSYVNSTNSCSTLPICTGAQTPTNATCMYPKNSGNPISCADGTTIYAPLVCPVAPGRWQNVFPPAKPMCSPLVVDTSTCTPLLFQRMSDFASGHAIQYATALLALGAVPVLAAETALVTLGAAVDAKAVWDAVFHNSAGEVVDLKVAADVPKSVMGDSIVDFMKNNPTAPYTTNFPAVYNAAAPSSPIVVDPNTGVITPVNSTVPLSSNQVMDAALQFTSTNPIPYSQIAPYITPERIPWIAEAAPAIQYDITHQSAPLNYPSLTRTTSPIQYTAPYYEISPNPLISPLPYPLSTPSSISGITPLNFSPSSPVIISPSPVVSSIPSPTATSNPLGTDGLKSPYTSPSPTTPIDPNAIDLPPVPPTLYPDTWKFFDFLPMANPFAFRASDFIPNLPQPICSYEIHRTFHVPLLGNKPFDLAPCVPLQPLRTVLAWVFSVLSLFACFFIIFRA